VGESKLVLKDLGGMFPEETIEEIRIMGHAYSCNVPTIYDKSLFLNL